MIFCFAVTQKAYKKKSVPRHKWTMAEIEETRDLFKNFFGIDKTPGIAAVKKAQETSRTNGGLLWKLPVGIIKSKVSWLRMHAPKVNETFGHV